MSKSLPSSLRLKVIAPHKLLVDEEVEAVSIPSLEGYRGVLPGHRPVFLALGKGNITYQIEKKEEKLAVRGGYAEVLPERVIIFTELSEDETEQTAEE